MNSFPLHVGDYIRDTVGLSMVEDGAYTRLLHQYYASEKPLPLERAKVYRVARAGTDAERIAVDFILAEYFTETDAGWVNKRCEEELARQKERSESAKESANERWKRERERKKREECERNANASDSHAIRNASHKPLAIKSLVGDDSRENTEEWKIAHHRAEASGYSDDEIRIVVASKNGKHIRNPVSWLLTSLANRRVDEPVVPKRRDNIIVPRYKTLEEIERNEYISPEEMATPEQLRQIKQDVLAAAKLK